MTKPDYDNALKPLLNKIDDAVSEYVRAMAEQPGSEVERGAMTVGFLVAVQLSGVDDAGAEYDDHVLINSNGLSIYTALGLSATATATLRDTTALGSAYPEDEQ